MNAVNLDAKFAKFTEHWQPKIIAQLNDLHIKAVKLQGEFLWHSHPETDELFFVHKGVLTIRLRDRDVVLKPGEMFVVPRGVEHMPVANEECEMLLIEPAGTPNTGNAGGDRTALVEPWI
jgi:mannose-6-phosphate isomerase-like protein (cupin superfamily)